MTLSQKVITIGMVVLGTALTRYLPFLLFPAGKPRLNIYSIWERCFQGRYLACWSSTACTVSACFTEVTEYRRLRPFLQ